MEEVCKSVADACANPDSKACSPKRQKSWQDVQITDLVDDQGLLVTHVNQTHDLMRLKNTEVMFANLKATDDWIQVYSLANLQLSLEDLMKKGSATAGDDNTVEFTEEEVNSFESQLQMAIDLYDKRMRWLLRGSKKIFGVIQGNKLGVLIETSSVGYGSGLQGLQMDLLALINEQLHYMKKLYFISFGSETSALWEEPCAVNGDRLNEARQWVQELGPTRGCNLLKALKKVLEMRELDSLVIIVGSCPDQAPEILSDYIQQCSAGRRLLVHTVAYNCSSEAPPAAVKSLAEEVRGRYHCYSGKMESCHSTDIHLVLSERQKADGVLKIVNEIYEGKMGDSLFNLVTNSSTERLKASSLVHLSKPFQHERLLAIQMPNFLAKSSVEWLKINGLRAKKLSLYQVLAPNAFSPVEEFVPVLRKTVSSTLHGKAMMQFEWHNGTVKNVHVDPPILYNYQKQLGQMVKMYERRINWLSLSSRRIWGTVCEKRVVVLVDISKTNSSYIFHIQHSLRLLLEEQMASKDLFNILAFGSEVTAWQPEMVPPHPDNLQSAWRWVLCLLCKGSRNVLKALKRAVEVNFKDKDRHESQGVYLLAAGVPDQETHHISSYLVEVCGGCDLQLHVCLFSIHAFKFEDDLPPRYASPEETATAYKDMVQAANGRFHWFGETGINESDDISLILSEMEKAVHYSHKCAMLVESLRQKSGNFSRNQSSSTVDDLSSLKKEEKKTRSSKVPFPKPTALTLARMHQDGERIGSPKTLSWRPPSGKAEIPPVQPIKEIFLARKKLNPKSKKQPVTSISLLDHSRSKNIEAVFKKSGKKLIPSVGLPNEEEICSTKTWLGKCSLKKLKLDLPSLVFGPGSLHRKEMVESLHKKVSAKYCDIFPSVEMQGIVKHLQIQPKDLDDYIEQMESVLRCYVRRLQWLLSGSRRFFGVILEAKVCILIDTSGSMEHSLSLVAKELTSLIWEQLRKKATKFNLIAFAEEVQLWQECLVEATDEMCHEAAQWVSLFQAHGNTSILKALQRALSLENVEALYILTDGKPDTSCSLILKEIEALTKSHAVTIHTISFNCTDRVANDFLKKLASQTGGRYHRCHGDADGQLAAHQLLSQGFKDEEDPVFPLFEGDDLKKLVEEIDRARKYLTQAKIFRSLLDKKDTNEKNHLS
ncbi:von Willebrand factor A domain-containing protein 3A isoform X1 [Pantherophis guttatus]|uniref:von Willebrand factor A domain-containing protein 3A isoform X1 n=1 Tax=Pantherophis guttatus TaxID=94885 RepID=A0ABM3ZKG3_PANGU|nr:von Willebrand factor A domain-containing protein 3A isoform X1 [Pantherophis guttatus]XP_060548854.1 von Willebrand factor A domain-containing protein 3A isoform X1 [Pantherophis guttatus]